MRNPDTAPIARLVACRVIFVIRGSSRVEAATSVRNVLEAGGRAVELTFTVPDVIDLLAEVGPWAAEQGAMVGVGTVLAASQAHAAIDSGAEFVVSPGLDIDIVHAARRRAVAVLPGVSTATEVMSALRVGVDTLKLFPGMPAGPRLLTALRGPFPRVRFVPSGGVRTANAAEWFAAGAAAVGVGVTPRTGVEEVRELLRIAERSSRLEVPTSRES